MEVELDSRRKLRLAWVRLTRFWPWGLWGLLAVGTYLAIQSQQGSFSTVGLVSYEKREVALTEAITLSEIYVRVGDHITVGQPLVEAKRSFSDFEVSRLRQEKALERSNNERRYLEIEQRLDSELRSLDRDAKEDQSELSVLKNEYERLNELSANGLVDPMQLLDIKTRIARLDSRIETMHEQRLNLLQDLRQVGALKSDYDKQIELDVAFLQDSQMNRETAYTIRSEGEGVVSRIFKYGGDVALEGERILEWLSDSPPIVEGFLSLDSEKRLEIGQEVFLKTRGGIVAGHVLSIGPVAESIEDLSNPILRRRMKGRVFVVQPDSEIDCADGEQVDIYFERDGKDSIFAWLSELMANGNE